ncbi:MAG: phenylacetate--CoA ligase family protein [Acidobacteria bacterium]|nr:phenylacetate--CoA ligase family protein [Acidobacteriota bacterium]
MAAFQLESWLHGIIEENLNGDEAFRRFSGKNPAHPLTRSDVEAYRDFHLQRTLQYAYENSYFYREQFDRSRLKPSDIAGFKDLAKFPLTGPQHLAQYPYRFLCTSQAVVARPCIFVTSGTTGPQKEIFWSQWDLEKITEFMAAGISTVATRDDTVQILLPDGKPNSQADLLRQGVAKFGARPVVSGAEQSAEEQLRILDTFHSTILFGFTGQLYRISKELQPDHDLQLKGVKVLFLAGEYLPAARRRELETIWNCRVHTHYGLTEMGLGVAVECTAGDGYHFNEADLLLEIIDPVTGERVKPGDEGELVFTTLTREAMPLIRYRTHDLSRLIEKPCPCGATSLLKFDAVRKRLESVVTLGNGAEMYPTLFDDLLLSIAGVIDYRVKLLRHESMDRLEFTIETIRENDNVLAEINRTLRLAPVIADNIAAGSMNEPRVKLVGMGAFRTADRAKKMIVDCR